LVELKVRAFDENEILTMISFLWPLCLQLLVRIFQVIKLGNFIFSWLKNSQAFMYMKKWLDHHKTVSFSMNCLIQVCG